MTVEEQFESFKREYDTWNRHTETLPVTLDRGLATRSAFELDLDHVIDYVRPILAAAERSTQFDYPEVAGDYLRDLDQVQVELGSAPLSDADRHQYSGYLGEFRALLTHLGSLPVPLEGHLGFRKQAVDAFRFLVDEYGFETSESSPITVRFTRDPMFVELSHSPDCPMNSILVGKDAGDEDPTSVFVLDDFAYVGGVGILFDYSRFNLRDRVGIGAFLKAAAVLVHQHGDSLLRRDAEAFRAFQRKAGERERSYIEMMEREHSA